MVDGHFVIEKGTTMSDVGKDAAFVVGSWLGNGSGNSGTFVLPDPAASHLPTSFFPMQQQQQQNKRKAIHIYIFIATRGGAINRPIPSGRVHKNFFIYIKLRK